MRGGKKEMYRPVTASCLASIAYAIPGSLCPRRGNGPAIGYMHDSDGQSPDEVVDEVLLPLVVG